MNRILLLIDQKENRQLLANLLAERYEVIIPQPGEDLRDLQFGLGIVDGPALDRLRPAIEARRKAESPCLLPFLLITSRQGIG